jgi:3-oxoacid CoA-transferase B subunit
MNPRELIARRTAKLFKDGDLVNLGIGLPTMVMNYIPEDIEVWFESENGVVGLLAPPEDPAEYDFDLVDASGHPSTMKVGGSCFSSFDSFGLIRGGHVAYTVLGAYEVDGKGNLANWLVPGKTAAGMGGAMDLVTGAKNVVITMIHCDKQGNSKIKKECTLPLTGAGVVNYIITELCLIHITPEGPVLEEVAPGVTVEEVVEKTEATLIIPENVKVMDVE